MEQLVERHTPVLFKLVHGPNFPAAIQALILLFKIMSVHLAVSDRFYRALYGILHSKDLVSSSKTPQVLSLTLKAMRADVNIRRVSAFLKRLLQVSSEAGAPFCCGVLLLVSEVLQGRPSLWGQIRETETAFDDEEHYEDAPDDDSDGGGGSPPPQPSLPLSEAFKPAYDIGKREPAFCGAETACMWELSVLSNHVHPSVSAMAESLLAGSPVEYGGNPITDLSLGNFLSKFATKKSKAPPSAVGRANAGSMRLSENPGNQRAQVGTRAFVSLSAEEVPPEEMFFHRFYSAHVKRGGGLQGYQGDLDEAEVLEERLAKNAAFGATGPEGKVDSALGDYDAKDFEEEDLDELPDDVSDEEQELSEPDSNSSDISLPVATGFEGDGTASEEANSGDSSDGPSLSLSESDDGHGHGYGVDAGFEGQAVAGKRGRDDPMADFAAAEDFKHLIGDGVPNQGRPAAKKKRKARPKNV